MWWRFDDDIPETIGLERGRWRSPLHLPSWLARDFVKILYDPVAQRLQEITPEECLLEGIEIHTDRGNNIFWYEIAGDYHGKTQRVTAIKSYEYLWDSINPKYSWELNPWVFAYTIRLVNREERQKVNELGNMY